MAAPSSPLLSSTHRQISSKASVNINSNLRRNSLVSDHDDMMLLREKLTRIAVGRHYNASNVADGTATNQEKEEKGYGRKSGAGNEHFKVFSLQRSERPNTPPSSPQPRDVLRKQLYLKQHTRRDETGRRLLVTEDKELVMSVDEVEITAMDVAEEDNYAVLSPPRVRGYTRAQLSIPGHLRFIPPISGLTKFPEGLRKRKSVTSNGENEQRASLKKTSSQINILAHLADTLSRPSSATGAQRMFETRLDQDQDMKEASGCTTQPQSPQEAVFKSKHEQLSAYS